VPGSPRGSDTARHSFTKENQMNPFHTPLAQLRDSLAHNFEAAALSAVLTLMADAYSSGFVRGPGNNEYDYSVRAVRDKFGADNMIALKLASVFQVKLTV
jgi:hypothetical protein